MSHLDYKVLFAALGFVSVVTQGEAIKRKDAALRASCIAQLVEEFCRINVPEAFRDNPISGSNKDG